MKLTYNSGNIGLDKLIDLRTPVNTVDYGSSECIEFLVFMDGLDIEIAEDMLNSGDYND